jgi:aspartyl aminopeptidase
MLEKGTGVPFTDLSFDLCLYDLQPAAYGGLGNEFIHSGRLDNLAMCHAALAAFLKADASAGAVQIMALFDHEEVGSVSGHGARSSLLAATLERAALALGLDREAWLRLLPRSFLVSADMAHALHPNYPEKHDGEHFPLPNRGPVLKANANARSATDAASAAHFRDWARKAGVHVQDFVSRADLACGSTVGPLIASELGIPAVDVGSAMLSMHSAREMCGADDPAMMIELMREFYRG